MPHLNLSRRVTFSSGHRYWNSALTDEENRQVFGKWASPYNHGHNFVLTVTISGPINPAHGMVINIKDIDEILQRHVVSAFDQKSINDEISAFKTVSPSLENLVAYFRDSIAPLLPPGIALTGINLEEMPTLCAEWSASPNPMKTRLIRTYEFAASHRLHASALSDEQNLELFGKCNHVHGHGHNYVLEVTVEGIPDATTGMICPLEELDSVVEREILDRYDHRNLDLDVPELNGQATTSENVTVAIFNRLAPLVPAELYRIKLAETARNIFEVTAY